MASNFNISGCWREGKAVIWAKAIVLSVEVKAVLIVFEGPSRAQCDYPIERSNLDYTFVECQSMARHVREKASLGAVCDVSSQRRCELRVR